MVVSLVISALNRLDRRSIPRIIVHKILQPTFITREAVIIHYRWPLYYRKRNPVATDANSNSDPTLFNPRSHLTGRNPPAQGIVYNVVFIHFGPELLKINTCWHQIFGAEYC